MYNPYLSKNMKEFNDDADYNPYYEQHQILVKKHMIVAGSTGSGKTAFVTNLIRTMKKCFGHVQVWTADPDEKLYKFLKKQLKDKIDIGLIGDLPPLSNQPIKSGMQQMIIIDDWLTAGKNIFTICKDYALRSRKPPYAYSCVFLTQSYYEVDIFIRQQISYLILLKLTKKNMTMVASTLDVDISKESVNKILRNSTKEALNVAFIDLHNRDPNKTFRRNLTHPKTSQIDYYIVEDENGVEIPTKDIKMFTGSGILN